LILFLQAAVWVSDDADAADRYLPAPPTLLERLFGGFAPKPPLTTVDYYTELQTTGPLLGADGSALEPCNYRVQRAFALQNLGDVVFPPVPSHAAPAPNCTPSG